MKYKLKTIIDSRGRLTVLEPIKRAFWLYDVQSARGGHSHDTMTETLVAVHGSFWVRLDDGRNREAIFMNDPGEALEIKPNTWVSVDTFSDGAVCLCLADCEYSEEGYTRLYCDFVQQSKKRDTRSN